MKEEKSSLRVRIVRPFTTLRTFGHSNLRRMVINLDQLAPYEGTARYERLESKHSRKAKPQEGR
jgi:hypothetical protein